MLLERSHNALFLRKLPFDDAFVCSYFPTASLKNREVSDPSKRSTSAGTLAEEGCSRSLSCCLLKLGSLQPFFPVFFYTYFLYFLNHLANAVISGLGFFPSPSPCTHVLHPFERKTWWALVSELLSARGLTLLTDAFMLLSLEGDEFDAGHLTPDCRI